MATFGWASDVPSGPLKNASLSKKIRRAAIAGTKFMQFVKAEAGFGKHKGDSHTITKIKNLAIPASAVIGENDKVPIDTFAIATTTLTIDQMARGVEFKELALDLATFDLESNVQKALRNQLRLILDNTAAAAFKLSYLCAIPTSLTAITWDTDGTPTTPATVNLNKTHIGIIRDRMEDTYLVPHWADGEYYMCLAAVQACRGVKDDPGFDDWSKYIQDEDVHYKSEIGRVEGCRIVEVNNTGALGKDKGTGSVLGEAIIFGDDAVAMIEALTPELRAAIAGNFGLDQAVAWVGRLKMGPIWPATVAAGEVKIVRVTSS